MAQRFVRRTMVLLLIAGALGVMSRHSDAGSLLLLASPQASPAGSPIGTPHQGAPLLETVQAKQSATAAVAAQTATARANGAATARAQAASSATSAALTATNEANTALANAAAVSTENAALQTALTGLATTEAETEADLAIAQSGVAEARATITAQASELAALQTTGTAMALPTSTQMPTSTPDPTATSQPSPTPILALYQADVTGGFAEWQVGTDWAVVDGMLVNNGRSSTDAGWTLAPFDSQSNKDYAVEVEIQFVREGGQGLGGFDWGFGVVARVADGIAYWGGDYAHGTFGEAAFIGVGVSARNASRHAVANESFRADNDWHQFRLEVRGNQIAMLVDGAPVMGTSDNQVLGAGGVGIWCANAQVNIRSFKVIAL